MKKILILDFDGTIIDSNFIKKTTIINYIKKKYNFEISREIDNFNFPRFTRYDLISIAKEKPILNKEKKEIDSLVNSGVANSNIDPFLFELFKY